MSKEDDREYYIGRARKEREIAKVAINPAIAELHNGLAERYEERANALGRRPELRFRRG